MNISVEKKLIIKDNPNTPTLVFKTGDIVEFITDTGDCAIGSLSDCNTTHLTIKDEGNGETRYYFKRIKYFRIFKTINAFKG